MVRPPVDDRICLRCKGARLLCGKQICPILMKSSILKSTLTFDYKKVQRDKTLFGASPPAVFVGRFGYPNVSMGPMIPIDDIFLREHPDLQVKDTSILDLSEMWYGKEINDIITYRTAMVRSNFKINVGSPSVNIEPKLLDDVIAKSTRSDQKLLESSQELAMSKISVDTETTLSKLKVHLAYDVHSPPLGPTGITDKIKILDNIKVNNKVEYVVSDTDLKAEDAIFDYLFQTNLSKSSNDLKDPTSMRVVTGTEMQRLLSSGLLGNKKKRKIVPTRWSITAVDSIISKRLAKEIKYFPEMNQYITFQEKYLDNNFVILMMPGPWAFEMMEVWNNNTIWTQEVPGVQKSSLEIPAIVEDYELEKGRANYASNVTGAYYAARKEITEFLFRERRQARCIVFREVSGGYVVPLGVWVIRETIRNALKSGFNAPNVEKHDTLASALSRIPREFSIPLKYWLQASKLLENTRIQRRLDEWIQFNPKKIS